MNNNNQNELAISLQTLKRLPGYLHYLKKERENGAVSISAAKTARSFGYSEIQVRKDFAAVCSGKGKPKSGFDIDELINSIESVLGFNNTNEAVLAGVGHLGKALLSYSGFEHCGVSIVAAFDSDETVVGSRIADKNVLSADKISDVCRRLNVHIGIITVPSKAAQTVCDQFVAGGVKAIWNFANVRLSVPDDVLVQNENMAASLAVLSKHLNDTIHNPFTKA